MIRLYLKTQQTIHNSRFLLYKFAKITKFTYVVIKYKYNYILRYKRQCK